MYQKKTGTGVVSGILLPIGLVCLFAFCSLALALMGGKAYKQIQAGVDDAFGSSVAASYLRTKLSQNNTAQGVSLRDENGTQVLAIAAPNGKDETLIFLHEGQLMETYAPTGSAFSIAGGMKIAELESCRFTLAEDGLFTAEIISVNGNLTRAAFALAEGGTV